jgi:hypothetical protein
VGNTPAQLATKDGDRNWKNGARTNMEIGPNKCWSSYPEKNGRCSFHCSNLNVGQLVCFLRSKLGSVGPHSPWMNPRYHGIHIFIDLPVMASPPNFPEQLSFPDLGFDRSKNHLCQIIIKFLIHNLAELNQNHS